MSGEAWLVLGVVVAALALAGFCFDGFVLRRKRLALEVEKLELELRRLRRGEAPYNIIPGQEGK